MFNQRFWIAILVLLTLGTSACASTAAPKLTPVTMQLSWTHQAQFAGLYAADQKGYYGAEGLDAKFLEGGPNVDLLAPVVKGSAQFGVTTAEPLLVTRSEGTSVRAVATVYRRTPGVYVALASSGIKRPQDFAGKTIQIGARGIPSLRAIMSRVGLRPDQYAIVDSTPDLQQFYTGQVDVRSVFLTNEVLVAQAAGYKLNIIYPDDYGIHSYGDTLFTTDDLITRNPDLVQRFLRATLKGWTFAVENPASVGQMVLKYNPTANAQHEIDFMTASIPLVNTGEDHIGWMKPEIWAGMETTLREQGVLTKSVDVTQVYTIQFLREIYGK